MSDASASTKEMAELLRSGAKMLSYSCPECGSPLFQLKSGEIWCAKCKRRVVIVPESQDESIGSEEPLWEPLERNLLAKLSSINSLLLTESNPQKVKELSDVISSLLASIERLRRLKG